MIFCICVGDSAGANLAMLVALRALEEGTAPPRIILSICGVSIEELFTTTSEDLITTSRAIHDIQ